MFMHRFNGYDSKGNAKLDGLKNIYIHKVEFAGSLRDLTEVLCYLFRFSLISVLELCYWELA